MSEKYDLVVKMAIREVYKVAVADLDKAFNDRNGEKIIEVNNGFILCMFTILDESHLTAANMDYMMDLCDSIHYKAIEYLKSI